MALILLFAATGTACADTLRGVVIVVIDGDTLLFKPDHYPPRSRAFLKIRLADIDAPEKNQPHGEAATRVLQALVLNQRVEVDTVATDVYGRKVARIRKGALQVNAELVRQGGAWALSRYRRNAALLDAQHEARRAHRGLWQDPAPTPPWVWRRVQSARSH
ncbi:MAG TPA: thermonuclease family protein [Steroidobacteraceae bacterium]|nr:thermonuclease family protein [Steroidobacteraceae bacterium]